MRAPWLRSGLVLVCLLGSAARAETTVPLDLQVDLLQKVLRFERGLNDSPGDQVQLLLVVRPGHASSEKNAAELSRELERVKAIAGKPVKVSVFKYHSASELQQAVTSQAVRVVYLAGTFDAEMSAIASALSGVKTITVSTDGEQVDRGAVVGFELVSGRPKVAINLSQARKQELKFSAGFLEIARNVK